MLICQHTKCCILRLRFIVGSTARKYDGFDKGFRPIALVKKIVKIQKTHWLIVRSVLPGPRSWCLRSLCIIPISLSHALFFPPWLPIPLCHIVMIADHYQALARVTKNRLQKPPRVKRVNKCRNVGKIAVRSPRGQKVYEKLPNKKWKNSGIIV